MLIESAEEWRQRAIACEFLALSLRHPDETLVSAVANGEWLEAAAEILAVLDPAASIPLDPGSLMLDRNAAPVSNAEQLAHVLRGEATHLFVSKPDPVVSPYEGIWRARQDGVLGLLFVNPHSIEVQDFMKSCGVGSSLKGAREPLDHVATELEFMEYLAAVEAGIAAPLPGAPEQFPEGSAGAAFEAFANEHVLTWMPAFCDALEEYSRIPFYQVTALLLRAFVSSLAM